MKKLFICLFVSLLVFTGCSKKENFAYSTDSIGDISDNPTDDVTIYIPEYFFSQIIYFIGDDEGASTPEEYLAATKETYTDAVYENGYISYSVTSDEAGEGKASASNDVTMDVSTNVDSNIKEITHDDNFTEFKVTLNAELSDYDTLAKELIIKGLCYNIYSGIKDPSVKVTYTLNDEVVKELDNTTISFD